MATYTPRLSRSGMMGSNYWYNSNYNPYYPTYGLPNCTCYAFGRAYEYLGQRPGLPTGDAGTWFNASNWNKGSTPKLGAIICLAGGPYSGRGHVAVVEKIYSDGTVVFSQSGYTRDPQYIDINYFWTSSGKAANNYGFHSAYIFQGFLYPPTDFDPDVDPDPPPGPGPGPTPEPGQYPTKIILFKKQIYRNQGRLGTDVYT